MIRIFCEDTQWAIAGKAATIALEELARQLPRDLQGDGSRIVEGKGRFAALLVFGDVPDETLAKQLLMSVSPVYLLDFDDDAPVTLKFDRMKTRVTETRLDEHPADFLSERGIVAPGYAFTPSPVRDVSLVEGVSLAQAKRAIPPGFEAELREHPRGVLVINAPVGGILLRKLGQRGYLLYRDPENKDGWFYCIVYEPGQEPASYSSVRPDPNHPPLNDILGETTLEGILRVLAIPGELLGLDASGAAGDGR
jgi:hypothetical protein